MPKSIILKNMTNVVIPLTGIGEVIDALDKLDVTTYTAKDLRLDTNLMSGIASGDIVVNDGTLDLDPAIGREYVANDSISDEDGFWYGKRRRFSILWQQPSHGFVAGQVLRLDESTGAATLALADSHANSATTAVVSELIDVDRFYAGLTGSIVENIDSTAVDGGLPLTTGTAYFLSSTVPGQITATVPSGAGEIVKLVGLAVDVNAVMIFSYSGYANETALGGGEVSVARVGGLVRTPNTWQRKVLGSDLNDPVSLSPVNGDRYVVGTAGAGDWLGRSNYIAEYVSSTSTWFFTQPSQGFITVDISVPDIIEYSGSEWITLTSPDQFLFETITADTGTVTAATTTDTLNIVGGNKISTAISGNTLTIGWGIVSLADLNDVDTTGVVQDSIVMFNATSGNWEVASVPISTPQLFYGHNNTTIQTLTSSFSTLHISSFVRMDAIYSIIMHDLIINESGWYKISYSVGAEATGSSRSGMECQLELNESLIPGSMSWGYHRTSNPGENTATADTLVQITSGDAIRVRMRERVGSIRTMANGCRLMVEQIEQI